MASKELDSVRLEPSRRARVAIVEDDPLVRRLVRHWLEERGHDLVEFERGADALDKIDASFDVVCVDLGLDDVPGLHVIQHLRGRGIHAPIVVITAERALETAIDSMRAGAYDYVTKPLTRERLELAISRAAERKDLSAKVRSLESELADLRPRALLGDSEAMRKVRAQIARIRESDVTVCIAGESGTGKELAARAVHDASRRAKAPFVAINCAAIPAALQESELFGHERGAFTGAVGQHRGRFEQAHRGTLFLDELGEMSPSTQASLLRALQEKTIRRVGGVQDVPVDVRIVCATHRDLAAEVAAGRFREDLYFRLVVYPIVMPSLRDRRDDIPLLFSHFLRLLRADTGNAVERVTPEAIEALMRHRWQGNVRELSNVVHRALLACDGAEIDLEHLPTEIRALGLPAVQTQLPALAPAEEILDVNVLEKRAVARALELTGGNVDRAAKLLGMGRATLYRRLASAAA